MNHYSCLVTSDYDTETNTNKQHLGKLIEPRQEVENNSLTSPSSTISVNINPTSTSEQDDPTLKSQTPSTSFPNSVSRKLANDLSQVGSMFLIFIGKKRKSKSILFLFCFSNFLVSKAEKESSFS